MMAPRLVSIDAGPLVAALEGVIAAFQGVKPVPDPVKAFVKAGIALFRLGELIVEDGGAGRASQSRLLYEIADGRPRDAAAGGAADGDGLRSDHPRGPP